MLGGSWDDPRSRWADLRTRIASWTPDNNTFPQLHSHPQRLIGWAALTLRSTSLTDALEHSGRARIHEDVTNKAMTACMT